MIVEFIGCTGAGKTTLIAEVARKLSSVSDVSNAFVEVATPVRLQGVRHPSVQNLIQEAVGLPYFLGATLRYRSFLGFVTRMLARHGKANFRTLSYARSIERTLGVYEFLRRRKTATTVLVDEGTMVPAHNIFVYTDAHYQPAEISEYGKLAPLPDRLVYVRAPMQNLLQRARQRHDAPKELQAKDEAQIEELITRAVAVYEQLLTVPRIQSRTLVVENPNVQTAGRDQVVTRVTEFILSGKALQKQHAGENA